MRQLSGPRLQDYTESGVDGGIQVPVRERHVFIGADGTHTSKESSNSCPLCRYSLAIVASGKLLLSHISPVLLRRLLVSVRRSTRRGFFFVFSGIWRRRRSRIFDFYVHTFSLEFVFLLMETLVDALS